MNENIQISFWWPVSSISLVDLYPVIVLASQVQTAINGDVDIDFRFIEWVILRSLTFWIALENAHLYIFPLVNMRIGGEMHRVYVLYLLVINSNLHPVICQTDADMFIFITSRALSTILGCDSNEFSRSPLTQP